MGRTTVTSSPNPFSLEKLANQKDARPTNRPTARPTDDTASSNLSKRHLESFTCLPACLPRVCLLHNRRRSPLLENLIDDKKTHFFPFLPCFGFGVFCMPSSKICFFRTFIFFTE